MFRFFIAVMTLTVFACSNRTGSTEYRPPLAVDVTEYPTCLVLAFRINRIDDAQATTPAHHANIDDLKVRLPSGVSVNVMEQRFFWEEGGGELLVRLGKVPASTTKVNLSGHFLAYDANGVEIGATQNLPNQADVSIRTPLKYSMGASLAPTEDLGFLWLDIDAMLERPLHVSGLPGARIDRLRIEGPSGEIEVVSNQTFMPTATGGKIRVKVPSMAVGSRMKLKGWWVPLRTDNTPCCGEQALPSQVEVAVKDIIQR